MEKRPFIVWIPILTIIMTISFISIFSIYLVTILTPTVLFICGTIILALAFHYFSMGNAVYSTSASLKSKKLLSWAYEITTGGILISTGGGIMFIVALCTLIFMEEIISSFLLKFSISLIILCGIILMVYGLIREIPFSSWYLKIEKKILEEENKIA